MTNEKALAIMLVNVAVCAVCDNTPAESARRASHFARVYTNDEWQGLAPRDRREAVRNYILEYGGGADDDEVWPFVQDELELTTRFDDE